MDAFYTNFSTTTPIYFAVNVSRRFLSLCFCIRCPVLYLELFRAKVLRRFCIFRVLTDRCVVWLDRVFHQSLHKVSQLVHSATQLVTSRDSYSGWANDISNQDPRWTQKPIYTPLFTHQIRSWLLGTLDRSRVSAALIATQSPTNSSGVAYTTATEEYSLAPHRSREALAKVLESLRLNLTIIT